MSLLILLPIFEALLLTSYALDGCICGPDGGTCNQQSWAVLHNGLYWAYASPCSGGCSQLPNPLPYTWRRATDGEFAAGYPDFCALSGTTCSAGYSGQYCAANIFDPSHDHCDLNDFSSGTVTNKDNGGSSDTLIVHDIMTCSSTNSPTPAPTSVPTPAPTVIPTKSPTPAPTKSPSKPATISPTMPTTTPTKTPTKNPTFTPSKSPTKNPTKSPTIAPTNNPTPTPTNNPTPSPTFPEGAVGDSSHTTKSGDSEDTGNNKGLQSENSNGILGNTNNLMFIIIGAVALMVICCIIIGILYYKKRKKQKLASKKETNSTGIEGMAIDGTNTQNVTTKMGAMIQLGSVSPVSMNISFNAMSAETSGGIVEMDTNYENENETEEDENNDLFGDTGATAGEIVENDEANNHLPELPDARDSDEESESVNDNNDNGLYGRDNVNLMNSINTAGDMNVTPCIDDNMIHVCDECGETKDNDSGRMDENDGNWYCNECWKGFYD